MPDLPLVYALGFSAWKRPLVRSFLPDFDVRFARSLTGIPQEATVATWAGYSDADTVRAGWPGRHLFLEDGFLRSVGLGADLTTPVSWVVDRSGIYYDPNRPSDLETLLQTEVWDAQTIQRARTLRQTLLNAGLTKYNVGANSWDGLDKRAASGVEVVLVAGQVESDASIKRGAPTLRTNISLLRAARNLHPDAWLVYKPHPDVAAGLRKAGADESAAFRYCDEIVTDAPIDRLLPHVDVVHVLTSLTGFEALLREKRVVCHGLPFYAGWGLTEDREEIPRRNRTLTLDELVAGALIRYPRYLSRVTKKLCTVEEACIEMVQWRSTAGGRSDPWWRRALRPLLYKD